MGLKNRLREQLTRVRELSEQLLVDFKTPEQWTRQVHPCSNHALWFMGHMCTSDNFFISLVDPDRHRDLGPAFQSQFGMGSQPVDDPLAYPPAEEVREIMRERRATLLSALDALSDDDLSRPTEEGSPDFLDDFGAVFETAIWHEGVHTGQLTVVRRALGGQPVMDQRLGS